MKHAWFSEQAVAGGCGWSLYRHEDGKAVKVTCVGDTMDCVYKWDDKVYVGIVTDFISSHGDSKYE